MAVAIESSLAAPRVLEVTGIEPWTAFQRLVHLPHALFLDSAQPGGPRGRYSFITADPFAWITAHGDMIFDTGWPRRANPFHVLANRLAMFRTEPITELPPFQGGAAGLLGDGLCHHTEKLPRPEFDDFQTPDLAVGLYDWVLGFDHLRNRAWLVSTGLPERSESRAQDRMEQVLRLLDAPVALSLRERSAHSSRGARGLQTTALETPSYPVPGLEPVTSNFRQADYLATVRRAIEYVHAGDCFQVNVAQRLLVPARHEQTL